MSGAGAPRRWRWTAFRTGLLVGFAAVLGYLAYERWTRSPNAGFDFEVTLAGADLSRHGAAVVKIVRKDAELLQACRGDCDDLRHAGPAVHDEAILIKVYGRDGQCIACDDGWYVDPLYGDDIGVWRVAGTQQLDVLPVYYTRGRDGWKKAKSISAAELKARKERAGADPKTAPAP